MTPNRLARTLCALLVVLSLAACARIPLNGPVLEGQEIVSDDVQGVRFLPDPPTPGAVPDQIVRGFIEAGTGTQRNYETARKYLTDELAASWDPTAGVLVHQGPATYTQVGPDRVRVDISVVAEVGDNGTYTALDAPEPFSIEYRVQNVDGEWRIATAESGLVLMSEVFEDVFAPFTLYFFDATYRYLVPDVRWFPNHTTAPTRIVQAILGGPVHWLAEGAVTSAFPHETVLRGPVTVENHVATADFSQSISTASNDRFSLMLLQLQESLRSFTSVAEARMRANGASLDVALPSEGAVLAHATVNSSPLVYRDGQLGYLAGDALSPVSGSERLAGILPNLQPSRGTMSVDQGLAAFLTPRGAMAVPFSTGQPVSIDGRAQLAVPSIDPFGFVWTVSGLSGRVHVTDVHDQFHTELELAGLSVDGIRSLQVSRDGARLAALVTSGTTTRFVVAAIERADGTGQPTGIGTPEPLPLGSGAPLELTWVDETSIAMLVSDGLGSSSVRIQRIGGETTDYGAVDRGTQIAGSNTLAGLRVVDASGTLFVPRNNRWQEQGANIDFLVTQA